LSEPGKVFEKFYRGSPQNPGGLGLGLSIAQGFIEAQGGHIEAANHPEGGAMFTVILPCPQQVLPT
jgi:signal transduction histidine kinase